MWEGELVCLRLLCVFESEGEMVLMGSYSICCMICNRKGAVCVEPVSDVCAYL